MTQAKISRDDKQIQTRSDLIESGLHLIAENGYSAVSIRNISKHAGYTQGAFYSNFNNKEEFLLELMNIQFEKENIQLQKIILKDDLTHDEMLNELKVWLFDFFNHTELLKISIELQLYAARDASFALEYQKVWQTHKNEISKLFIHLLSPIQTIDTHHIEQIVLELISLSYGLALQYMIFKDDIYKYIEIMIKYLTQHLHQTSDAI